MSSSIAAVPYVCLYNGARGINFYSGNHSPTIVRCQSLSLSFSLSLSLTLSLCFLSLPVFLVQPYLRTMFSFIYFCLINVWILGSRDVVHGNSSYRVTFNPLLLNNQKLLNGVPRSVVVNTSSFKSETRCSPHAPKSMTRPEQDREYLESRIIFLSLCHGRWSMWTWPWL